MNIKQISSPTLGIFMVLFGIISIGSLIGVGLSNPSLFLMILNSFICAISFLIATFIKAELEEREIRKRIKREGDKRARTVIINMEKNKNLKNNLRRDKYGRFISRKKKHAL